VLDSRHRAGVQERLNIENSFSHHEWLYRPGPAQSLLRHARAAWPSGFSHDCVIRKRHRYMNRHHRQVDRHHRQVDRHHRERHRLHRPLDTGYCRLGRRPCVMYNRHRHGQSPHSEPDCHHRRVDRRIRNVDRPPSKVFRHLLHTDPCHRELNTRRCELHSPRSRLYNRPFELHRFPLPVDRFPSPLDQRSIDREHVDTG